MELRECDKNCCLEKTPRISVRLEDTASAFVNLPEAMVPVSSHVHSAHYTSQTAAWVSCWCVCPLWSLCSPYSCCTVQPGHSESSDCNSGTRWERASHCRKNKSANHWQQLNITVWCKTKIKHSLNQKNDFFLQLHSILKGLCIVNWSWLPPSPNNEEPKCH